MMAKVRGMAIAAVLIVLTLGSIGCWSDSGNLGTQPVAKVEGPPKPLYQRLGGEQGIRKVVDDFVPRAAASRRVNFWREGTGRQFARDEQAVDHLKQMLVQFIARATGGPQPYTGRDMKSVHQGMRITGGEFDALLKELKASLKRLKVGDQEQKDLFKVLEGVRKDIVEVP
jgi:hemoglobin